MASYIGRRKFLAALGGAAAAWPLAARAEQSTKLPTIGFLGANNATFERASTDAVQRLRELGWIENRTVAIEYRWAEGRDERFAEIAAEFIRLKVDVILTYATLSSIAAKKATARVMNARLFTRSPRRRGRAACQEFGGRADGT
jgi:putative ABC transport system substrate-binding protein